MEWRSHFTQFDILLVLWYGKLIGNTHLKLIEIKAESWEITGFKTLPHNVYTNLGCIEVCIVVKMIHQIDVLRVQLPVSKI